MKKDRFQKTEDQALKSRIAALEKRIEMYERKAQDNEDKLCAEITVRKATEEALDSCRLQLSEVIGLSHIAYWGFDLANEVFIFNDDFYALYGTTAGQEGGYRMSMQMYAERFIHPDDISKFFKNYEKIDGIQGREITTYFEHRFVSANGKMRHMLNRTRILKDADGHIIQLSGANQDITERKEAEEEKEILIVELKESLAKIKTLHGLLPICAWCKKIRDDAGYWQQLESYIGKHSDAEFSHGICPECMKKKFPYLDEGEE